MNGVAIRFDHVSKRFALGERFLAPELLEPESRESLANEQRRRQCQCQKHQRQEQAQARQAARRRKEPITHPALRRAAGNRRRAP